MAKKERTMVTRHRSSIALVSRITLVFILFIGVISIDTPASGEPAVVDYRDIAAQLTQRGEASVEGVVTYRQYQFRIETSLFDQLVDVLVASQDLPQADLNDQVQAWLDGNLPLERAAWSGVCAFLPGQWQINKHRIEGVDTTAPTIQALAAAAGANAPRIPSKVIQHVDGVVETTIEDGLTVYRKPVAGAMHPLAPLDISLATWQDAIDLGANVVGQEIHGEVDGSTNSITYVNSLTGGSWVATTYSFDASLDWAPRGIRSFDEQGTLMRVAFGYAPTAPEELTRPRAVAKGIVREEGNVDASVWLVDAWEGACDPALVELREPALYLELDFMAGPGEPVTTVHDWHRTVQQDPVGAGECDRGVRN